MKEIDVRLNTLPDDKEVVSGSNLSRYGGAPPIGKEMTVPDAVLDVLERAPRPLLAREVISALQARSENTERFEPAVVHSALYRLKERKTIKAEDDPASGKQAFSLVPEAQT